MTTLEAVLHPARALGARALGRNLALGRLAGAAALPHRLPLAMLVYGSLHTTPPGEAGAFNLDGYRAMLSRANALVLLNTIGLSLVKTGCHGAGAVPRLDRGAHRHARTARRSRC